MVKRLALRPTDHVLEIGPGPGWFSPVIAQAIPQGRLVLFDIQDEMLRLADLRLKAAGVTVHQCLAGDAIKLPFEADAFDAALRELDFMDVDETGQEFRPEPLAAIAPRTKPKTSIR